MKTKALKAEKTPLEEEREDAHDTLSELIEGPSDAAMEPLVLTVAKTYTESGKMLAHEEEQEDLDVMEFLSDTAKVGMELSQTINMGNYESVRIAVNIQVPCYPEEVANAYEFAAQFCKERLENEREEISGKPVKKKAKRRAKPEQSSDDDDFDF